MDKFIYMDNAATTYCIPAVKTAMMPYLSEEFGNPSSIYTLAQQSKNAVEESRRIIARTIGAKPAEIYFTGGGSESDNMAVKTTAMLLQDRGKHIITTKIEHHAILNSCKWLEEQGFRVTYLNVEKNGVVNINELLEAIEPDTILISVMMANNEIGTIQPIERIGRIAKEYGILFHTDAVQAYTHIPINVNVQHIDMMSVSAHKIHGPKGVGFIYIRENTPMESFIHGGGQERGRRAGTENVPGIVGMGKAAAIAMENMRMRTEYVRRLRDYMIGRIRREIKGAHLNGDMIRRLPNNINFSFENIQGESLLVMLDIDGICASTGSACTTGSNEPSHVLLALGMKPELAYGSIRLTLGEDNTRADADYVVEKLKSSIKKLRENTE